MSTSNAPLRPPADAIRESLKKLLESKSLKNSEFPKRLLEYVVQEGLMGHEPSEKDVALGGFGKNASDYDDGSVRTAAKNLRSKLHDYYSSEGSKDAVRIEIPKGGYTPAFRWAPAIETDHRESAPQQGQLKEALGAFYATRALAQAAMKEHRFTDVLSIVNSYLSGVDELALPTEQRVNVPNFRTLRLLALMGLNRHDELLADVRDADLDILSRHEVYPHALSFCLISSEKVHNEKVSEDVRKRLWALVDHPQRDQRLNGVRAAIIAARGLNQNSLQAQALELLRLLGERLIGLEGEGILALSSEIQYVTMMTLRELEMFEEALQVYENMESTLLIESDEVAVGYLAWAATEATRVFRDLKRYNEANELATSLADRFGDSKSTEAASAAAWALAERYKAYFDQKDFDGALACCAQSISNPRVQERVEVLAWLYARRAMCLRRTKDYVKAIDECDAIVAQYSQHSEVTLQRVVAFALIEKTEALKQHKRLAASILVAREVIDKLAAAEDKDLISERISAIHSIGEAQLCEAKLLLRNDLLDDASLKLAEALGHLTQAAEQDSTVARYHACKAYAEFLQNQRVQAKESFLKALSVARANWVDDLPTRDWVDFDIFPIPQDDEFFAAATGWRLEQESNPAKRKQ